MARNIFVVEVTFKTYWGILRHYWHKLSHIQTFRTLCNPCIYNCAIFTTCGTFRTGTSSKACQIFKMIKHISSPGIVRTVYSSTFKDSYGYLWILMHIQPHSQVCNWGKGWDLLCPFLKIKKSAYPDSGKKALIMFILGLKNFKTFSCEAFFPFVFDKMFIKVPCMKLHKTFHSLKNFWLHTCTQALFFLQNAPSQMFDSVLSTPLSW